METKKYFNPAKIKDNLIAFIKGIPGFLKTTFIFINFFILLLIFLFGKIYSLFERIFLIGIFFKRLHQLWNDKFDTWLKVVVKKIESKRIPTKKPTK